MSPHISVTVHLHQTHPLQPILLLLGMIEVGTVDLVGVVAGMTIVDLAMVAVVAVVVDGAAEVVVGIVGGTGK
jgi:hypothetical protein